MPWTHTDPVNERLQFIALHQEELYSVTELCDRFGVSRDTGYRWIARYRAEGVDGLKDRSHAPKYCPHRMDPRVEALLLAARRSHPLWGPRKILAWLAKRHPALSLPAPSTVGDLYARLGLIEPRRRRRRGAHPGAVPFRAEAPNQVWCADFKGQFPTRDGVDCYPLTVSDAYSRYLLGCTALLSTKACEAVPVFTRLFETYGLPEAIRTDNGIPFATNAICGLSALSVWWTQLGIVHHRIEPGRPEQNGRHERMHRTLKAETTRPPEQDQANQQRRFDSFRAEFNMERPHEALENATPASHYNSSARAMPKKLPAPEYPGHFLVRKVCNAGTFRFKNRQPFLSSTLKQEHIGLEEVDDGVWSIYFYTRLLARISERDFQVRG